MNRHKEIKRNRTRRQLEKLLNLSQAPSDQVIQTMGTYLNKYGDDAWLERYQCAYEDKVRRSG